MRIIEKTGGKVVLYDDEGIIAYIGENKNIAREIAKQMIESGKRLTRLNGKIKKVTKK